MPFQDNNLIPILSIENQPAPVTFSCVKDSQDDPKCIILFASSEARNSKKRRRRDVNFLEKIFVKFSENAHHDYSTTKKSPEKRKVTTLSPTTSMTSDYSRETSTKIITNQYRPTVSTTSTIGTPTTSKVVDPTTRPRKLTIPDELLTIPTTPSLSEPNNTPLNISEAAQIIANKYCRYRDPGLYKLPLICDVFISCSLGGKARPMVCPKGTGFNPRINVCDHASYYECNTDNILGKVVHFSVYCLYVT